MNSSKAEAWFTHAYTVANARSQQHRFIQVFRQNWENVRLIKNERLSFTNIYAIVAAGVLSLIPSVRGEFVLEICLHGFLCIFSAIGLLTTPRLKAELEQGLQNIEHLVNHAGMQSLHARGGRARGVDATAQVPLAVPAVLRDRDGRVYFSADLSPHRARLKQRGQSAQATGGL